jgi:N-acetylglucosaminyldiphosphoundecaprenol N-acetyl-beta-D-mannosaminyltransferase
MTDSSPIPHRVLGLRVDATSYADATASILAWAREGRSAYVCAANVHMVMEAHDDPAFQALVNAADLVTPDGMPLVWSLRARGQAQARVYGPDLMLHVCAAAARADVPIGLHGATVEVLDRLRSDLPRRFPGLRITYTGSPPFRDLTSDEDDAIVRDLGASGARIVFVALGCPKQERWMAAHRGRVSAVMIGVGAAFAFHAGEVPQAPAILRGAGLEWAFRLAAEPRRLWGRMFQHNPRFVVLAARELLAKKLASRARG